MPGMNPQILKDTLGAVSGRAGEMTEFFYGRLFLLAAVRQQPEVLSMFPVLMDAQRGRLLNALVRIVGSAADGDMEGLTAYLEDTGRDHRMIGALCPEHYDLVGEALLATLAEYAGDAWTAEAAGTWEEAYGLVSSVMIKAMEDDGTPRWWEATVTSARMLSREVLGFSVRLSQPASWIPGQSVKAEITSPPDAAPAIRRYLTPANDPGDGTWMDFHLKVIPWGLFSPAMARSARPGAQLRLSAPGGTLRLDEKSSRPVLMIAGSTGLAPMLAMIGRMTGWDEPPETILHFGAATPDELYARPELEEMTASRPWLTVRYAVEAPPERTPGYQGAHGTVVDAALRGDWRDRDVYACGPLPMVRAAVRRLNAMGVPPDQVHAEAYGTD